MNPAMWFANVSPEWAVFLISMIPITELRASIPIGIEVYGLPTWKVWVLSVIGDLIPALCILAIAPIANRWAVRTRFFGPLFTKRLTQAEKAFSGKYEKYGAIGLIIFIGIPLPLTGSWTGSLAAFVFNIPFKKSVFLIALGACLAATIVTLITLFAGETIRVFL